MIAEAAVVAGAVRAGGTAASPTPPPAPGGGAASDGWPWDAVQETICGRADVAEGAVALVRPRAPRCGRAARAPRKWALTFAPPSRRGAAHPRGCVELRFPSLDAALAYASAQGLRVEVCGTAAGHRPSAVAFGATPLEPPPRALWWALDGRAPVPEDLLATQEEPAARDTPAAAPSGQGDADLAEAALLDPAAVFAAPMDVAAHPRLTPAEKREILARWAWDARLIEAARAEGMPADAGEPSRLEEVLAARRALEAAVAWPPLLQAPAAFAAPRPASTPPAEAPAQAFVVGWSVGAVPSTAPDGVADSGSVGSARPGPRPPRPA